MIPQCLWKEIHNTQTKFKKEATVYPKGVQFHTNKQK